MKYSQNGEEIIITNILEKRGELKKFVVELGAGDGYHLSNSRYFIEKGWDSILIDADNKGNEEVKQHKINKENINQLLKQYNCPKEFDFLSIDLDGNDYWIIDEILKEYSPRLIVAEYNASFPPEESKTIKYDPEFIWQGDTYFGFTLKAGIKLAEKNNYKAILQDSDMNIYMLRNDLAKGINIKEINYNQSDYFKKSERTDWEII
jgi:hypothetical protein